MARETRTPRRRKQWGSIPAFALPMTATVTSAPAGLAFDSGGNTVLRMMGEYIINGTPGGTFAALDQV